jgi:hypothetical protein
MNSKMVFGKSKAGISFWKKRRISKKKCIGVDGALLDTNGALMDRAFIMSSTL